MTGALMIRAAFSVAAFSVLVVGGASPWHQRHQEAVASLDRLDSGASPSIRELVDLVLELRKTIDVSDVHSGMKEHAHKELAKRTQKVDEALAAEEAAHVDVAALAQHSERAARELRSHLKFYHRMVRVGSLPGPGPEPGELAAALKGATGVDVGSEDGALFRVLLKQFNDDPPREAFGVSAKFRSDGTVDRSRYHVALALPCNVQVPQSAGGLRKHATEAASVLHAPDLVHDWIDQVVRARESGGVMGLGFGFARLPDGSKAGKIYVINQVGQSMPELPLSQRGLGLASRVHAVQALPTLADSLQGQVVSLEWRQGDDRLVLRHYHKERGVADADRIRKSTDNTVLSNSLVQLMQSVAGTTETSTVSAPFRADEVGTSGQPPAMVQTKVGVKVEDRWLSQKAFLEASGRTLDELGVAHDGVTEWMEASGGVDHAVSNVQVGDSFITLYRHPTVLCYFNGGASLAERKNTPVWTACDNAIEAFTQGTIASSWDGSGCGACAVAANNALSDTCRNCMTHYKYAWALGDPPGVDDTQGDFDFPIYCWDACKTSWTQNTCPTACTSLIENIQSSCSQCTDTPEFEVAGGRANKDESWFEARNAGGTTCAQGGVLSQVNEQSTSQKRCIEQMYASTDPEIKKYTGKITDGDVAQLMTSTWDGSITEFCQYPMHDWWSASQSLCQDCHSKAAQIEAFADNVDRSPCFTSKQCNCPDYTTCPSSCSSTDDPPMCDRQCQQLMASVDPACTANDLWCEPNYMDLDSSRGGALDLYAFKKECFDSSSTSSTSKSVRTYADQYDGGYIFDTSSSSGMDSTNGRGFTEYQWRNTGVMKQSPSGSYNHFIVDNNKQCSVPTFSGAEHEQRILQYKVKCRLNSTKYCYSTRWNGDLHMGPDRYSMDNVGACATSAASRSAGLSAVTGVALAFGLLSAYSTLL